MAQVSGDGFWRERRVLVTGCNGFLGSWLTRTLVERGARVVGLIRDAIPDSELIRSGTLERIAVVHGGLDRVELLERALGEHEVDTVFHLAAQAIVSVARRDPLDTLESNVRGSWNLLEACRRAETPRIVLASSDKAYGAHERLPYTEDLPLQGRHPYDVSKSCADLIATAYHRTYGLPLAITRCGNLFGGGDLNWDRLVPGTIRSALQGAAPVIRSDGSPLRDYVWVGDAVRGYLDLARALDRPELHGEAFNFGTGSPRSVLEITRAILDLAGSPALEPRILGEARDEIPRQYLSAAKARRELGWSAAAPLERALADTVDWYRAFLGAAG